MSYKLQEALGKPVYVAAERQRWAGGLNREAVSKPGIALTLILFTDLLDLFNASLNPSSLP
jgi:hypothetical protein